MLYKNTIRYHTISCNTIPYDTIQYHTIPYHTIQYHDTILLAPPYCIEFLRDQVLVLYVQYQYILVVLELYHLLLLTVITHCKIQI